ASAQPAGLFFGLDRCHSLSARRPTTHHRRHQDNPLVTFAGDAWVPAWPAGERRGVRGEAAYHMDPRRLRRRRAAALDRQPLVLGACRLTARGTHAYYRNSAASTTSPGPKPSATHGRKASLRRRRSRMNKIVGDDMLPYSVSTSREAQAMPGRSPSDSSTAPMMRGPPGWIAHEPTSPIARRCERSQVSSQGRRLAAMRLGTFADSVISKPWLPMVQVMACSESANRHEPLADACQASAFVPPTPTTAAEPSPKRALPTMRLGFHG